MKEFARKSVFVLVLMLVLSVLPVWTFAEEHESVDLTAVCEHLYETSISVEYSYHTDSIHCVREYRIYTCELCGTRTSNLLSEYYANHFVIDSSSSRFCLGGVCAIYREDQCACDYVNRTRLYSGKCLCDSCPCSK